MQGHAIGNIFRRALSLLSALALVIFLGGQARAKGLSAEHKKGFHQAVSREWPQNTQAPEDAPMRRAPETGASVW